MREAQDERSSSELIRSNPKNDDVKDIERRISEARAQELEDANEYRTRFFYWGVGITTLCVVASIVILIVLMLYGVYETAVGVAFISGLAVEVVGIAAIIAKYLFPDKGAGNKTTNAPSVVEEDEV